MGSPAHGGDSSAVQCQLGHVCQIQATSQAFAAVLKDGSVVTWGNAYFGGDSSTVQDRLQRVQQILSQWFCLRRDPGRWICSDMGH